MHRLSALAALLALVLTACGETSKLDRSVAVVVSGRVLQADGSPAGGVPVALEREPSVGEIFTGLVVIPLTLFTACLADPPAALCKGRSVKRATTTADGRYSFNLTGDDTQTSFGNARSFTLSTGARDQVGPVVSASFKIQTEALALPDLQLWQPAVTVAAGRVGWSPPAAGEYRVVLEDTAGQLVWTFDSPRTELTFDPRILEDTTGSLAVSARTTVAAQGTTVTVRRQSGRVAYRSAAGPPLSRGRPCTLAAAAASVTPCPVTDGNFANGLAPVTTTTAPAGSTVAPAREAVTVDLGRPADVSLIVVRGCSCDVERSTDGQTWTAVGRASGLTALIPSRAGPARYVRLTGLLTDLHEVSVWEGAAVTPAAPAAPGGTPTAAAPAAPPAIAPAAAEPSRTAPALVALAALMLAAIAAGAVAVRRH
jgi:hypothetical protein